MGYYDYGFRPYVSVAERRRQAQREIEKKRKKGLVVLPVVIDGRVIAKTFWGKAWCDNLESYSDFENRLPRGRTYVRNGSVVHLEIRPGKISALVSGSELYSVEITISSLPKPHWKRIKTQCAGKIGSLVELLQARLSKSVMEVVTRRGEGLFPKPAEIKMKCSCPDWAGMCKHVAAVMYGVGARLDDQPELLFLLREIDHLELIADAARHCARRPCQASPEARRPSRPATSRMSSGSRWPRRNLLPKSQTPVRRSRRSPAKSRDADLQGSLEAKRPTARPGSKKSSRRQSRKRPKTEAQRSQRRQPTPSREPNAVTNRHAQPHDSRRTRSAANRSANGREQSAKA